MVVVSLTSSHEREMVVCTSLKIVEPTVIVGTVNDSLGTSSIVANPLQASTDVDDDVDFSVGVFSLSVPVQDLV